MKTIFIVDDEQDNLDLLHDVLSDDLLVKSFISPLECISEFKSKPADIVLLDVNMPEMSGLDTCKQILLIEPECPVLFISGSVSDGDRLFGFEAGGYDYINKPINIKELLTKVTIIVKTLEQNSDILAEKETMISAFMETVTGAGEQGIILQFASRIFELSDYGALANELVSTINQLGLKANIMVGGAQAPVYINEQGTCSPMISNVLNLLKAKQRIYEFNGRIQFNEKNVSVLISEMPRDEAAAGRFKDHILLLLRIASECAGSLDLAAKNLALLGSMKSMSQELQQTQVSLRQRIFSSLDQINGEIDRIESDIQFFSLSEQQEQKLATALTSTIDKAQLSSDKTALECQRLDDIIAHLNDLNE